MSVEHDTDTTTPQDDAEADSDEEPADPMAHITTEPGRRWTANADILVIESELLADGKALENPAMPIDQQSKDEAMRRVDEDQPAAWRHINKFPRSNL